MHGSDLPAGAREYSLRPRRAAAASAVPCGLRAVLLAAVLALGAAGAAAQPAESLPGQRAAPTAPPAPVSDDVTAAPPKASDPRSVQTAVEQATRLLAERRPADALAVLEVALRGQPRDPQLRFLYGVGLTELGRDADAIAVFEQLTDDFPELAEPYNNLAVLHAAAGRLDQARGALEAAVRALPGYALAHENLGDLYLRLAERAWARSLEREPRNAPLRERLGLARALIARSAAPAAAPTQPASSTAPAAVPPTPSSTSPATSSPCPPGDPRCSAGSR